MEQALTFLAYAVGGYFALAIAIPVVICIVVSLIALVIKLVDR